jgi:XrtN system VIT domain protein
MKTLHPDKTWYTGIALLLLSSATFFLPPQNGKDLIGNGLFFVNYLSALAYLFLLWLNEKIRRGSNSLPHLFLLLNLALLSCYALNHTFTLFGPSAGWLTILLVISGISFSSLQFFPRFPFLIQGLISFIAGVSIVVFLYLAVLLAPGYVVGILAAIVIGLSLHLFVPALYAGYIIVFVIRANRINRRLKLFFFAGLLFALGCTTQYAVRWHIAAGRLNKALMGAKGNSNGLPEWITVAQCCPPSSLEETILKSPFAEGLGYEGIFGWQPRGLFNEKQDHDPLVVVAAALSGGTDLDWEQRIHILNALFDARHKTEQRRWSSDDLITTDIATSVQLWPQLHLSYTEENITVANPAAADSDRWNSSEEALYTFHLPEGAVVSALSLWINGKEEKAVLSTRQGADSAYATIVGSERRDPSVVHWQEGNTVVVRVFPVTTESRRFKLGITAPLEKTGGKLAYRSVRFDGPSAAKARTSVRFEPMQRLIRPEWPSTYSPRWTMQCEDPGILPAIFPFDGKLYVTATPEPAAGPADLHQAFLDLNNSWTAEDYEGLLASLAHLPVYASRPGGDLIQITASNRQEIFEACTKRPFSLFPLYRISDCSHALLISKCSPRSPNLSDLNGSPFARQLQDWLARGVPIRLYNIGDELSPYLRALRETGAFHYEKGDLYTLQSHLHHNAFPIDAVAPNEVLIEPAALLIRRTDDPAQTQGNPLIGDTGIARLASVKALPYSTAGPEAAFHAGRIENPSAPDHLLRLFAYRRILQQLKGRLPGSGSEPGPDADNLQVRLARQAGIVSPVSSYVVLESQADYDRFNIREDKNGLKNASLQGKGAVPEPGEWAILISILGLFASIRYHRLRKQQQRQQS